MRFFTFNLGKFLPCFKFYFNFFPNFIYLFKNFLFIYFLNCILFNFTILYWFCHISKWICHRYTCVPHAEPFFLLPPHTIPLGSPSAPAPSIQYLASNLDWWLVSYMILYIFQWIFLMALSQFLGWPCSLTQWDQQKLEKQFWMGI